MLFTQMNVKKLTELGWSVSNVKNFTGREGYGFNAVLNLNGKKVAYVDNMADGGEFDWRWLDQSAEAKFKADLATFPPETSHGITLAYDQDIAAEDMVCEFDFVKKLKAAAKKKTLLLMPSDVKPNGDFDSYQVCKTPYNPILAAKFKQKYPGIRILNEELA